MKYQWQKTKPAPFEVVDHLTNELAVSPIFAQILAQRGITSRADYEQKIKLKDFQPYDPFLMDGMKQCCDRINRAIEQDKKILIYGDYDADGVTGTAVLYETLMTLGAKVDYYIPDRFTDGYGPNLTTYQRILKPDLGLLITVDNGVSGMEAFAWAKKRGIEIIVCDHHEIPDKISGDIDCLIHPENPKGNYPNKKLAGVGVAFKVATALLGEFPEELLDLVAIGTISDVVELTLENRFFVLKGLAVIKSQQRMGLAEILKQIKVANETINDETIGFQIAPRINSAGRLSNAGFVVNLLTTFDENLAENQASELESLNQKRKDLAQEAFEQAWEEVKDSPDQIIVAASAHWHEGVIGIVAAKIAEKKNRPTIIFQIDEKNQIAKGSARTSGEINLYEVLIKQRDLLLSFGGHPGAAGMSISTKMLTQFHDALQNYPLDKEKLINKLVINVAVNLSDFKQELLDELETLRPFGPGNAQPVFLVRDFEVANSYQIGQAKAHLKLTLTHDQSQIAAIGFQFGPEQLYFMSQNVTEIAGYLTLNNWNNRKMLQFQLLDFALTKPIIFDQRQQPNQITKWQQLNWPLVFFSRQNATSYQEKNGNLSKTIYNATADLTRISKAVLVDQPKNKATFKSFLKANPQLTQLVLILGDSLNIAVAGFPSRADFTKSYKEIYKQKQIPLSDLRLRLGLNPVKMKVILNVFFDLNFVTIKKGFLLINEKAEFHSLADSPVYQNYYDKYEFQSEFLLCSRDELKAKIISSYKENKEV